MIGWFRRKLVAREKEDSPTFVDRLVESITDNPGDWSLSDEFWFRHSASKVRLWIGNNANHVSIECRDTKWRPAAKEQQRLWAAYVLWLGDRDDAARNEIELLFIHNGKTVEEVYGIGQAPEAQTPRFITLTPSERNLAKQLFPGASCPETAYAKVKANLKRTS